ncbi:MAG TPA: 23S rRNA (uracil(1939)-C(5))-methyltransferase RlmD [Acholeplasmataceae bacterium]|nr:23S rRNA (uracil(1939)-C(5))-methyltransferase RlmD [Acholeplasmataceae bacterium]
MKINEKFNVLCVDLTHDGLGVCKIDNFSIFVKYLLPGEEALIKIIKINKSYGFGEIINLINKSINRIEPICKHYYECGGCDLLHMNYESQLEFKKKMAEESFKRLANLDLQVNNIYGMDEPFYYRNKVQVFFDTTDKLISGFYQSKTHKVFSLEECFIQTDTASMIVQDFTKLANKFNLTSYNETTKKGVLRSMLIRNNSFGEYVVVIIVRHDIHAALNEIGEELKTIYPNIIQLVMNINSKETNKILGKKDKIIFHNKMLYEEVNDIKYVLDYRAFFQVNHIQMINLFNKVKSYITKEDQKVVDGYCGVGAIALQIADKVQKVFGIEIIEEAIGNANINKEKNNIKNVEFILGKTEEKIKDIKNIDCIIIDPPRKGLDIELINAIIDKQIKKIIYISCNVSTLARDLALLDEKYDIVEVNAFDLFPNTKGLEMCSLLTLKCESN